MSQLYVSLTFPKRSPQQHPIRIPCPHHPLSESSTAPPVLANYPRSSPCLHPKTFVRSFCLYTCNLCFPLKETGKTRNVLLWKISLKYSRKQLQYVLASLHITKTIGWLFPYMIAPDKLLSQDRSLQSKWLLLHLKLIEEHASYLIFIQSILAICESSITFLSLVRYLFSL